MKFTTVNLLCTLLDGYPVDMQWQINLLTSDYLINCFLERKKKKPMHVTWTSKTQLFIETFLFISIQMEVDIFLIQFTDKHAITFFDFLYKFHICLFQIHIHCCVACFVQFQNIYNFLSTCNSLCYEIKVSANGIKI